MSYDQALDKLSEKLISRLLVQEEHGFQKGGTMCPLGARAKKKCLAWIGLSLIELGHFFLFNVLNALLVFRIVSNN